MSLIWFLANVARHMMFCLIGILAECTVFGVKKPTKGLYVLEFV